MNEKVIYPFDDIVQIELPDQEQTRYGGDFLRTVKELQVGTATNELNPKIMRVDQSGMWLGRKRFVSDPNVPPFDPTKPIAFQVDMQGNVIASSYKTNIINQRVEIINDEIIIYDTSGIQRMVIGNNAVEFYDEAAVFEGQIFGTNVGGGYIVVSGQADVAIAVNGSIFVLFDDVAQTALFQVPIQLPSLSADPAYAVEGVMFYADATHPNPDEVRVYKGGSWRNVITT